MSLALDDKPPTEVFRAQSQSEHTTSPLSTVMRLFRGLNVVIALAETDLISCHRDLTGD